MKTLIEKLKQNKMAMCLFIIAFVLIVTGVTYGVFETFIKGEKEHVININQIKFAYYEKSGGLSLDNNSILSIEDGKNQTSYFDFDISLTTDNETNIMYNIVLEEDTSSTLDNSKIKVYLTNQNNVAIKSPLSISDLAVDGSDYRILYSTTISSGQTQNYRLRAWIDKTQDLYVKTNENGNHVTTLERASYKFKVNVYTIDQDLTAVESLMLLKDNQSNSGLYTVTHKADRTLQIGNGQIDFYELAGDLDANGVLDENDSILLRNYLAGNNPTIPAGNMLEEKTKNSITYKIGDLNNDGVISAADELRLEKVLSGTIGGLTEYRYRGASPKNYVTFNNEVWRIIGIFPTDDGNGNIENRIKLIKNDSIGQNKWNENGTTNWAEATLNTYLNGTYYNTLNTDKNMIDSVKYYLGSGDYNSTSVDMYSYERKIDNSSCTDGSNCYYAEGYPNSIVSKIGLIYVSDYGYATENCENKKFRMSNGPDNADRESVSSFVSYCDITNWLYSSDGTGNTIAAGVFDRFSVNVWEYGFSSVDIGSVDAISPTRPTVYLKSTVKLLDGDGTSSNPYKFSL